MTLKKIKIMQATQKLLVWRKLPTTTLRTLKYKCWARKNNDAEYVCWKKSLEEFLNLLHDCARHITCQPSCRETVRELAEGNLDSKQLSLPCQFTIETYLDSFSRNKLLFPTGPPHNLPRRRMGQDCHISAFDSSFRYRKFYCRKTRPSRNPNFHLLELQGKRNVQRSRQL